MIDLTGNNETTATCADWLEAKKQILKWTTIEKEARIHLINTLNKHQEDEMLCGQYEVTITHRKGSDGRVIGLDDVGTVMGIRKSSQSIKINQIKG